MLIFELFIVLHSIALIIRILVIISKLTVPHSLVLVGIIHELSNM